MRCEGFRATRCVRRLAPAALPACALLVLLAAAPARADSPSDAWITTKVKGKLLAVAGLDGLDVSVEAVDGRVTLQGDVATPEARARAVRLARDTAGVVEVCDLLTIEPRRSPDAGRPPADDAVLERRVEAALAGDAALAGSDIRVVSVSGGRVLLAGRAESLSAHRRALENVRGVEGVTRVESEIEGPAAAGRPALRREGAETPG